MAKISFSTVGFLFSDRLLALHHHKGFVTFLWLFLIDAANRRFKTSMMPIQKKPTDRLVKAYNQMMTEMRSTFERADKQSNSGNLSLQKALDIVRHKTVQLGKISAEEAIQLSEYIKRDINDAAELMMESSDEFYNWLALDIEVIERKIIDTFLTAADSTRLEIEQFKLTRKMINPQINTNKR